MTMERLIPRPPSARAPLSVAPAPAARRLAALSPAGLQRRFGNQGAAALLAGLDGRQAGAPAKPNVLADRLSARGILRKPTVGSPSDASEREADRVADRVMRVPARSCCGPCVTGREWAVPTIRRESAAAAPLPDHLEKHVRSVSSGGEPLPATVRADMEPRFGRDFSAVRIHRDAAAAESAKALGARAWTLGQHVSFGAGQWAPGTPAGDRLIAHELTHTLQAGGRVRRQGNLEVERPQPAEQRARLTERQIEAAIQYNNFRFKDPFTLATIRELVGISRFPAVSDRELALAIAAWQADHGLEVDGKIGPATTASLTAELAAQGQPELVTQLRRDNSISISTVGAVIRTVPTPAADGQFQRNVTFSTSLRNGWIVQVLTNTWNQVACGGAVHPTGPTLNYSEAWWVDGSGNVRVPTSVAQPPTHAAPPGFHDMWNRPLAAGTSGTFTMSARLFTTLRLPAGFGIGAVADAGILPAMMGAPAMDDLGLMEATRRESGTWNGCPGVPNFHRP